MNFAEYKAKLRAAGRDRLSRVSANWSAIPEDPGLFGAGSKVRITDPAHRYYGQIGEILTDPYTLIAEHGVQRSVQNLGFNPDGEYWQNYGYASPEQWEPAEDLSAHPDPWMDNEPGSLTLPEKWTKRVTGSTYDEGHPLWEIAQRHPNVDLSAWQHPSGLKLNMIQVAPEHQGNGYASAALRDLTQYADQNALPMALTPGIPEGRRGLSQRQLRDWYGRHGFVPNKGRNKNWAFMDSMVRPPR